MSGTELTGTLVAIKFEGKDAFFIGVLKTPEEEITVLGEMMQPFRGREYRLWGEFTENPKYGRQFRFHKYEELDATEADGVIAFLSSGVVKGIGPKKAMAIAEKFGLETFRILEESPKLLAKVKGITEKKALEIAAAYEEHKELAEVVVALQEYGIGIGFAMRLYQQYGSDAVEAVKDNPFQLVEDVDGIGFKKADEIAAKLGCPPEDEGRIRSGIKYILNSRIANGHVFMDKEHLVEAGAALLEIPMETVREALPPMSFSGMIRISRLEGRELVYLPLYYEAERFVAAKLAAMEKTPVGVLAYETQSVIDRVQRDIGIHFSDEQRKAIESCMKNSVCVVTGGPGTGKTTIINGILRIFKDNGIKTALSAPTGRAAKRITQTTGHEASTIHRLLEYAYQEDTGEMRFGKDESNLLEQDAIIVDEMSMVDLLLMQGLLKALKPGARLILVGDGDQLPSVGAGNVLADILASDMLPSVRLREIFRQAQESQIVVNAHRINRGEYPIANTEGTDFFFIGKNTEEEVLAEIVSLCKDRLPKHFGPDGDGGEIGAGAETGAQAGALAETGADGQAGAFAGADADGQTGALAETGADGQAGALAETGADGQAGALAETDADSDAEAGTLAEAGADAGMFGAETDSLQRIQVITPMRKRGLGTVELNKALREALNPPQAGKAEIESGGRLFREGDKVMQNRNDYLLKWKSISDLSDGEGVFNGDVGYITKINEDEGKVMVVYDDRFVTYDLGNLEEIEPAFAVTIHKSQGSEFPVVVIPVVWCPPVLATRNLIYTAVTRAKQAVVLVGMERFLRGMVENDEAMKRDSALAARLREAVMPGAESLSRTPVGPGEDPA